MWSFLVCSAVPAKQLYVSLPFRPGTDVVWDKYTVLLGFCVLLCHSELEIVFYIAYLVSEISMNRVRFLFLNGVGHVVGSISV